MNKGLGNLIVIVLASILTIGMLALECYILGVIVDVLFATGHTVIAWLVMVSIVLRLLFNPTKRGDK